ncbi:sulfur metabolite repression control protein-like protein SconB [Zopfia rhizophila CBS 207.26]|uniref:Sulfur metabolite repression control protein-like protein SconB n=1 Tax=Zopfia rhizophila CBS 207.26 TaxID=1314779 RepID=A0A6A6DWX5_9PEZI|nr:sulfur metabolite repression control protein-like protein SconB [Zopfia rhizophila CBS 207.26]
MASNTTRLVESIATDRNDFQASHNTTRRRMSWRTHLPSASDNMTDTSSSDPHTALLQGHDHEGVVGRTRHLVEDVDAEHAAEQKDDKTLSKNASKQLEKMITPYLAQHIPQQYNPLGGGPRPTNARSNANTKYCYRHRPDLLCRRQADEPSMEQLQEELGKESQADQQSIANVWSLFSAAPSKHRNLMLQGILAQCCFPQLSFISSSVRNLIKIDFLAALPTELGFKVLCYLDTTSLCKAAQVSRRWRQLADDDVVWHKMCEQHIDRKCTKCGWGLPLLDRRRLRTEKRRIQLRASGRVPTDLSLDIEPVPGMSTSTPTLLSRGSNLSDVTPGSKRAATEALPSPETPTKRPCTEMTPDQQSSDFEPPKKRPWKAVYKDRFVVGTNWKYGRYSTRILKGHTNGVMCLQFDDQSKILMTGSYDATVKVWDLESGKEIRTIIGHTQGIRCLHFDNVRLITGSLDNTIKVWNWRTGECVRTLAVHSRGVIGLHTAEKLLASGSADNTIVVHDFEEYKRYVFRGHTDWVNSVKIDYPSRTIFSASDDCTVKLWDIKTQACIKTFEGHVGQVQQVLPLPADFEIDEEEFVPHANNDTSDTASLSSEPQNTTPCSPAFPPEPLFPDEPDRPVPPSYMLTGSLDGTIRLWHVPSGRCVHRFFGHVEGVWSLAADSLRLVSGAEDKTIKIWDPRTGRHERTLTGHTGPVNCVGLSDSRLISGSEDGTVRVHCFWGFGTQEDVDE